MEIPCGFHGFHMEFFWLRAQPFWCNFPCSFHMETPWNFNIPWNISLESRWNPPQFLPWNPHIPHGIHIFHMESTYSVWIPHIPWNIALESRWNRMESTTIPSMESTY